MTEIPETCKSCHDPLTLTLDPEDEDIDTRDEGAAGEQAQTVVPDDLLLPCGCHFHWQCLLDQAASVVSSLTCPSCASYLPSSDPSTSSSSTSTSASASASSQPAPTILTTYTNEGGVQPSLDIFPALREESYLAAHPEARPARAFHTLAAEGDTQGLIALLADLDSNDDDSAPAMSAAQLLTWRDPLNDGRSALHVALEAKREEVVWLLLWLGSAVAREQFPGAVVQVTEGMGLPKGLVTPGEDVRFVRDEKGRTAGDVCLELGGMWGRFAEGGLFS
ncbi:hypothetical protein MFIFM68171_06498 [Madurella fahalii]|uniref:RING-type domain-containing protein n=1 Tax=Madurella fahalii TaxID=1157608 RepID=A0ABQ0GEV3_9PEZI